MEWLSCQLQRTGIGIDCGVVDVVYNVLDLLDRPIPNVMICQSPSSSRELQSVCKDCCGGCIHLEVAANEKLARHVCGLVCRQLVVGSWFGEGEGCRR